MARAIFVPIVVGSLVLVAVPTAIGGVGSTEWMILLVAVVVGVALAIRAGIRRHRRGLVTHDDAAT